MTARNARKASITTWFAALVALSIPSAPLAAQTYWIGDDGDWWVGPQNWSDGVPGEFWREAVIDNGTTCRVQFTDADDVASCDYVMVGVESSSGLAIHGNYVTESTQLGVDEGGVGTMEIAPDWTAETDRMYVGLNGEGRLTLYGYLNITDPDFRTLYLGAYWLPNTGSGHLTIGTSIGRTGFLNAEEITALVPVGDATVTFAHEADPYYFTSSTGPGEPPIKLSGTVMVNHEGPGRTILVGTNEYEGGTNVNGGTLVAGAAGALGLGPIAIADGTLVFDDGIDEDNPMTLTGNAGLGVYSDESATVFSDIAGTGDGNDMLTKVLGGTLVLTGDSTYGGGGTITDGTAVRGGTLQVDGGSISHPNRYFTIGDLDGDDGTLRIVSGASVENLNATLATEAGSTGTAVIEGAGSRWQNNLLIVGAMGEGTLTVAGDATVSVATDALHVGLLDDSTGTLNIGAGAGAGVLDTPQISGGDGAATINFDHTDSSYFLTRDGSAGGAPVPITGNAVVKHFGGGTTTLPAENTYTDGTTIRVGTLRVTGAISHPDVDFVVGDQSGDDGTLEIADGGAVSNAYGNIANLSGSEGTANVAGAGSTWTVNDDLRIGRGGIGTMTIESGGAVTARIGAIGDDLNGEGTAIVTGDGSSWTNSGDLFVGQAGDGMLGIEDGGHVINEYANLGNTTDGVGAVLVTGDGSTWTCNFDLRVGRGGTGELTVEDGGAVHARYGVLGDFTGAEGTATVTGQGSIWTNSAEFLIGVEGDGTLTLADQGTLEVADAFTIARDPNTNGTLNVGDGGAPGFVDAASVDAGAGDATINFDHSDADYRFTSDGTADGTPVPITGGVAVNHVGTGTTVLHGLNTYVGPTTIDTGTLIVEQSADATSVTINAGGTLGGGGLVASIPANAGTVAPGRSIDSLTIGGDYNQTVDGTLAMELAGTEPGEFDNLSVLGTTNLDGALTVELIDGFTLAESQSFRIVDVIGSLSGQFAGLDEGALVGTYGEVDLLITYAGGDGNDVVLYTEAANCTGDIDGDGEVGLNDLSILLSNFGLTGQDIPGDLDGDDDVDLNDLSMLLGNFGIVCP